METFLFGLKKAVSAVVMPVPVVLVLGLLGIVLLVRAQHRWLGGVILSFACGLLLLASLHPVADGLTAPLEAEYPAYVQGPPVDYVVVLGASHASDPRVPVSSVLGSSGLYRLVEGVRVLRLNPEATLIVSGYARFDPQATAEAYRDLAVALGVAEDRIIVEPRPKDTAEEAMYVKNLVGDGSVALVTSASHMPRAMALFQRAGLNPQAAPTDFMAKQAGEPDWRYYVPDARALAQTQLAWHEWLGRLWAQLRQPDSHPATTAGPG